MNISERIDTMQTKMITLAVDTLRKIKERFEPVRVIRSFSIETSDVKFPRLKIETEHTSIKFPRDFTDKKKRSNIIYFFNFLSNLYSHETQVVKGQLVKGVITLTYGNRKFMGEYSLSKFLKGEYDGK